MISLATLRQSGKRLLGDRVKRALRTRYTVAKQRIVNSILAYDARKLQARLRRAGVRENDTLLVHANFTTDSGFRGTPKDLVNALADLVGAQGNLLMVSIPFRGSAYDYLVQNKPFNVKKTISLMGMATETFRRREGTLRSLHPTHPVLAYGKDAEWLVADHDKCLFPCGDGSPFDKFRQLRGKILFFDVGFGAITFFHHVEDLVKDRLPFPVYHERVFEPTVIDMQGQPHTVRMRTFHPEVTRKAEKLEQQMLMDRRIRAGRVGNSRFLLVTAEDVVSSFTAMVDSGRYPYHVDGGNARVQHEN